MKPKLLSMLACVLLVVSLASCAGSTPTPTPIPATPAPSRVAVAPTLAPATQVAMVPATAMVPTVDKKPSATDTPGREYPATQTPATVPTSTALAVTAPDTPTPVADTPAPLPTVSSAGNSDPDLVPGFPVQVGDRPPVGPESDLLLGNVDSDPAQEIVLVSTSASGPDSPFTPETNTQILALKGNGSVLPNWPVKNPTAFQTGEGNSLHGPSYGRFAADIALGHLSAKSPSLDVIALVFTNVSVPVTQTLPGGTVKQATSTRPDIRAAAYSGLGSLLPGWPNPDSVSLVPLSILPVPPSAPTLIADLNGDGLDEVFVGHKVLASDGSLLSSWSLDLPALAAGDVNGDGRPEIVTLKAEKGKSSYLLTLRSSNSAPLVDLNVSPADELAYPLALPLLGNYLGRPVIGDVDGDGSPEIIVAADIPDPIFHSEYSIQIFSSAGALKRVIPNVGNSDGVTLTLGDLNCDGRPEIVSLTDHKLFAWTGDGAPLPGWPVQTAERPSTTGAVIGDVDGDGRPDVVTVLKTANQLESSLVAYDGRGQLLARFPKRVPAGYGANVAIGDVLGNGRNQIIMSTFQRFRLGGRSAGHDVVMVYDLHGKGPYGKVHWGQFAGGPEHQSYYKSDQTECAR